MSCKNPLGQSTVYPESYDASLLFPIPRSTARDSLGLSTLPFTGVDYWTAYEVSWLDSSGKPQVRVAEVTFPCSSAAIVESKSFKLYLNSFNQTRFDNDKVVKQQLITDLSQAVESPVSVTLFPIERQARLVFDELPGHCLDREPLTVEAYQPDPTLLRMKVRTVNAPIIVYSHLLKTNCPVTGQPDWATVFIEYTGKLIEPASLLAYIISFRGHQDYHEHCIEQLFCDLKQHCEPKSLAVYGRYLRRGGLDINPLRSNFAKGESRLEQLLQKNSLRTPRQ